MAGVRAEVLTPRDAPAGIAVLAVSGADRFAVLAPWLRTTAGRRPTVEELRGAGPRLLHFCIDGAVVDELLFVDRSAVGSSELHLHGSPAVVDAVAAVLAATPPSAPADPAERLCREARDELQLALGLEQRAYRPFAACLARLAAAGPDALAAALERSRVARALAEPCEVALVGRQNAGKSTLFNALLLDERVLTGATPGLTRDPVSEPISLGGYPYVLVDTAGDGEALDDVDRAAIARAQERAAAAQLRIHVVDRSASGATPAGDFALTIHTHVDRPARTADVADAAFDLRDPAGWVRVRGVVGALLRAARRLPVAPERGVGGPAALDADEHAALRALA